MLGPRSYKIFAYLIFIIFKNVVSLENGATRSPRFLSSLFNSDTLNCAPQVMCELISANEPGPRTDTLNDYKYLIKEYFLKSDSSERIEPEEPKPNKLRSNRKDNSASTSSSSEEDVSPEKKSNRGVAELMELEEEDEIENTAIADLVNGGDPDHLAFALADVKRKFKLQEKIASKFNDRRVRRDLKTSDLADFVTRKAKELKETTNVMDRIGIAAQIGERTRNSRQCRALFNPCSMDNSKIKGLVDSLKNIVSSDRKKEKVNELDVAKLIKDAGLYNTQGLTDVKVVLNIGGGGPVNGIMDHVQSTTEWPQPSPTTIPTTTQSPPKPPPKSLSQTIKMNKTNKYVDFIREDYKPKLNQASRILQEIPKSFPKNNFSKKRLNSKINNPKIQVRKIHEKSFESNSESNSIESSEEEIVTISPIHHRFRGVKKSRVLISLPFRNSSNHESRAADSWFSRIYHFLFRAISPLG